ncbi:hypothetical protein D0T84_10245 [Dysgonomonas sp. 521]|uniref:hypothetical protein n=1 Tax=Dysgonomonas sp. 521 TaxID=2302932 RepID=UPI0013D87E3D|nr:hypothetical protein [Dysgonomonas sp. 521]NDV95299.1 hypothetical protein [Dysgonomonas sp. 521]
MDTNGQVASTSDKFGKFIATVVNWRDPSLNTLWGDGTDRYIQKRTDNDPCPPGWKVPSQKQWGSENRLSHRKFHQTKEAYNFL